MICPKCNAQLAEGSKFCIHCGTKIETVQQGGFCTSCGEKLKPGSKFCVKCGAKQGETVQSSGIQPVETEAQGTNVKMANAAAAPAMNAQPVVTPQVSEVVNQQVPQTVNQQVSLTQNQLQMEGKDKKKKEKKGGARGVLTAVLVILILAILLTGGYLYLTRVQGVDVLAKISVFSGKGDEEDDDVSSPKTGDDKGNQDSGESKESEGVSDGDAGSEAVKGDEALFDETDELSKTAQDEYDDEAYTDAHRDSKKALQNYLSIAEKNNLKEEAQDRIEDAYEVYVNSLIAYGKVLEKQEDHLAATRYDAIKDMTDPAKKLTEEIKASGYSIDDAELEEYSSGLVDRYREFYIKEINSFADSEKTGTAWPRDDAWKYASNAYSIQENGKVVMFNEDDLDDPLRMRYVFCLAWITTKRCEQGIADGSMNEEDAANTIKAILEETDYNPLLIQTYITYAKEAQLDDVSKYQDAYDAIVNEIKKEQNLAIVSNNTGVNSSTSVDLRYFRYFNDLDGNEDYLVDVHNGTTQVTRDWIRSNIPEMLE